MAEADAERFVASLKAGPYTVRGVSVGGVYTTLQVPELGVLLDVGMPLRGFAATDRIFLSHGHADHIGGLISLLGVRGMMDKPGPAQVFLPTEIVDEMRSLLASASRMQRFSLEADLVPMHAEQEIQLTNNLWVRAFRTHHPVPSLGYQFFRRVKKLKSMYQHLTGQEIAREKQLGTPLFEPLDHLELCYATDTLARVLDTNPSMLKSRVLVLECTFYDERKSLADSRAGCHIHLDELLACVDKFENEHIVLMHTSQLYAPYAAREILQRRGPAHFTTRVQQLLPARGDWP